MELPHRYKQAFKLNDIGQNYASDAKEVNLDNKYQTWSLQKHNSQQ